MNQASTLVLGAGELGMAVLRGLASQRARDAGDRLAVLLRPSSIHADDPDKQRDREELRDLGVDFVPGDLVKDSVDDLASIFAGFGLVIACTGFGAGRGVQLKIVRAALAAGVRRYVPWQFGVDYDAIGRGSAQDLFDEQLDVRDLLRSQDATEWVIVSTGMFTSFLFEPSFGVVDVESGTVRALGGWDNRVTVTTAADIGRLTAVILGAEPRVRDEVVFVAGDTVTYAQVADAADAALGRKLDRVAWDVPTLRDELAGDPDDAMKKYRVVFAEGRGVAWDVARTFNARRGVAVADLKQWAKSNLPRPTPT